MSRSPPNPSESKSGAAVFKVRDATLDRVARRIPGAPVDVALMNAWAFLGVSRWHRSAHLPRRWPDPVRHRREPRALQKRVDCVLSFSRLPLSNRSTRLVAHVVFTIAREGGNLDAAELARQASAISRVSRRCGTRRSKVDNGAAERACWKARDQASKDQIHGSLKVQRGEMSKREKQYVPYPVTWLNQKRYLDETGPFVQATDGRPQMEVSLGGGHRRVGGQ
jgi:hypothetical protein